MVTRQQHGYDKKCQLLKFYFFEKAVFLNRIGNHTIPLTIQTTVLLMEKTASISVCFTVLQSFYSLQRR